MKQWFLDNSQRQLRTVIPERKGSSYKIGSKGVRAKFRGDGNILYYSYDGGSMSVYICHKSLNCSSRNSECYFI